MTLHALKLAVTSAFKADGRDVRLMNGGTPESDGDLYELFVLAEAVVALRARHGLTNVVAEPSGSTYKVSGSPSHNWQGLSWFRVLPSSVVLRTGVEIDCADHERCEVDLAVVEHAAAQSAASGRTVAVSSSAVRAGLECKHHVRPPSRTIAQGATMTAIRLRIAAFSPSPGTMAILRNVPFALVSPFAPTTGAATVLQAFQCDVITCGHPGRGSAGLGVQTWIQSKF